MSLNVNWEANGFFFLLCARKGAWKSLAIGGVQALELFDSWGFSKRQACRKFIGGKCFRRIQKERAEVGRPWTVMPV